ncbi:MAG: acyltransferase family protein [Rubrobacteraceae bacterium]
MEGLRAVAVGAVLLYHAGLPFAPGGYVGVDIFFVISGFLITGLLMTEIERTGTISLKRFYSRRAKRLLPVTVVVLGAIVVFSRLLLSPIRMDQVSFDVATAGLYVVNWRLVAISKTACPLAEIQRYNATLSRVYHECGTWRKNHLERIERERPGLIIATMQNPYTPVKNGRQLGPADSAELLEKEFVTMLEKFQEPGARVAVIKDNPHPAKDIPECVSESLQNLEECATPREVAFNYPPVNVRAAKEVEDATLVDPTPVLCLENTCPAVMGDVMVYRNGDHITSTYVRSLAPWLGEQLPKPADP